MAILTCGRVDKVHLRQPHAVRGNGPCAARGPHSCCAPSWTLGPGGASASAALRAPRFPGCGIECSRSRHGAEQGRVTANADVAKRRAPYWCGSNDEWSMPVGLARDNLVYIRPADAMRPLRLRGQACAQCAGQACAEALSTEPSRRVCLARCDPMCCRVGRYI